MKTLQNFLIGKVDDNLFSVVMSVVYSAISASKASSVSCVTDFDSVNVYGEKQLALDILFDEIISSELSKNPLIGLIASEEMDGEHRISNGDYAVCYDPLDGSSLIDVNLSVGSIFGVYKTDTFIGVTGREQLCSFAFTYGPRTTLIFSCGEKTHLFELSCDDVFILLQENLSVSDGKMFAPGNMAVCQKNEKYFSLVNFWIKNGYKLRYSGGMVPDISQILIKGNGIFAYPADEINVSGKLRLLFECAPLSLLVENAGGASSNGKSSILDVECVSISQQTPIFIGSRLEVDRCEKYLV